MCQKYTLLTRCGCWSCDTLVTKKKASREVPLKHIDIPESLVLALFALGCQLIQTQLGFGRYTHAVGLIWIFCYRTLHSYKLFWAVCHLFPQRWQTLNIQSRETIGQEDHVTCLKLRRRVNLSPAFGATHKTRIFYKYVVFKYPCSLLPNFFAAATHSLQHESTGEKSNTMDGPRRHSYTMTMRRFPVSEKLPVSNHKKRTCNSFVA